MLQAYLTLNVIVFFLVFARVGMAVMLLPGFSAIYVPEPVRLLIALLLSFAVMPVVAPLMPEPPKAAGPLLILLLQEALIGAFIGGIGRIMLSMLQTAGTLVALFSSLANAFVNDPIAEQQSSVFSGFLVMLGLILVFATDTHHLMIRAVVDSYSLFAPGHPVPVGDMADYIARKVAETFTVGVRISAPFVLAGIAYYLGLGVLGRLMPQLPVFFFGLPIQVASQLAIVMIALPGIMLVFMNSYTGAFRVFLAP